ncbi:hypothetical protein BUALT_Bualt10G0090000 [Buddleja alternifolia]|uniref:Uncharacterized protein n=1 Tax=Buddleja alternifolia TaxID=168488 RepID=A0AAV6X819_9LAMI|nr:hypothetical protein BUALT_Bualt10G0090000 [Buddleja alternifolia]
MENLRLPIAPPLASAAIWRVRRLTPCFHGGAARDCNRFRGRRRARGIRWKMKMVTNLMKEGLAILKGPEHATNKWRSIMSHKWNKSKKTSLDAWTLNVSQAFHAFFFQRTDSTRIPTFILVWRGLFSHYDMKKSFGYLADGVLGDATMKKHGCHPNGTRTRNILLMVAAVSL